MYTFIRNQLILKLLPKSSKAEGNPQKTESVADVILRTSVRGWPDETGRATKRKKIMQKAETLPIFCFVRHASTITNTASTDGETRGKVRPAATYIFHSMLPGSGNQRETSTACMVCWDYLASQE